MSSLITFYLRLYLKKILENDHQSHFFGSIYRCLPVGQNLERVGVGHCWDLGEACFGHPSLNMALNMFHALVPIPSMFSIELKPKCVRATIKSTVMPFMSCNCLYKFSSSHNSRTVYTFYVVYVRNSFLRDSERAEGLKR